MITNSSPLIIFGKLNRLELLEKVFGQIEIAESVFDECVKKGKESNKGEVFLIDEHIQKGMIKIKKLNDLAQKKSSFLRESYPKLDKGESDTIALALQKKEKNVLIDEKIARKIALLYGVYPIGVLGVLLLSYKKNLIDENEINQIIEKLVLEGFRVGAEVIDQFWKMLDILKEEKGRIK
jgi:uncharacterized protein